MGTNYYAALPGDNVCKHCGRGDNQEDLHIGKSSAGWCFSLHVIPERGLNTLEDWKVLLAKPGVRIRDEYGDTHTLTYFLGIVTERSWASSVDDPAWYRENHAQRGPNGLARHKIDEYHTIGHGEWPWDYCIGEFS